MGELITVALTLLRILILPLKSIFRELFLEGILVPLFSPWYFHIEESWNLYKRHR